MHPQTERNRKGHEDAERRGFKGTGSGPHGWRDAKVVCVKCGHKLPWYHKRYQREHRDKCGE